MIKNIVILVLLAVNGTLIYSLIQRNPAATDPKNGITQPPTPAPPANFDQALENAANTAQVLELLTQQDSYATLAEQLRKRGLSEDLVRQMVLASINRDFLLNKLIGRLDTPYWKRPERDQYQSVMVNLEFEEDKRNLLLEIFGEEIMNDPLFEDLFKPLNENLAFLSSDRQIALDSLMRSNRAENSTNRNSRFLREARDDLRASSDQLQRSIEELLTADEYLEYQLRESAQANQLRRSMDGMDYGEQEFRDIFEIHNSAAPDTERQPGRAGREAFLAARQETNNRVRDYLGEQRYEEYARLQDPVFRSLQSVGERYETSDSAVLTLYQITNETNEEIREVTRNRELSRPGDSTASRRDTGSVL